MPADRPSALILLASLTVAGLCACSSSGGAAGAGATTGNPDNLGGASGSTAANGGAGGQVLGGGGASGIAGGAAGASAGGTSANGGAGGAASGGAASQAGSGGSAGLDPGDTPPWRPLNVTAPAGTSPLTHSIFGNSVGLDPRAKPLGKLVVDLGVTSGGYQPWLGKRGFHVFGVSFPMCGNINTWSLGRDYDGDCRLNTFDGMTHGTQSTVTPANSIATKVATGLKQLQQMYPTEDWGYFLNQDDTVRWSDVAFSGMSHGATTAAVIGKAVRLYRVVSRSGPRDNTCGTGAGQGDFNPAMPPWMANCPDTQIASWLDAASATPINRFYALIGMQDVEYGDIQFAMERMKYPGEPVRWDVAGADLTTSNRYYSDAGHLDFLAAANTPLNTDAALNAAFGVPAANQSPTF